MSSSDFPQPFIKKFCDGGFFYIYDVNTNQVIEVEKPTYDIIDYFDDVEGKIKETSCKDVYKPREIKKIVEKIREANKDYGIFSSFKPVQITFGLNTADGVKKIHDNGLNQILIELTRACNLNCSYCPTSGKYSKGKTFQVHMSKETCKRAVDFFCMRSFNPGQSFITFYGGEPMARFDLIMETVKYVNKRYSNKKYGFNLTTNGTIINKEILDFFIENDINIMVSLDGPEQVNNRYRRFKNGRGSFKRIMKNLEFIKNYNQEYYSGHVSISSVLAPSFDKIDETLDFFSSNETINLLKGNIRASAVDTRGTSFIEDFGLEQRIKKISIVNEKFIERLKRAILDNQLNQLTIEKNQLFNILYNLAKRPKRKLYEHMIPIGACNIGMRRVFVTTNGDFHICERVDYSYRIGCIDKGFDYDRIASYYRKAEETFDDCKSCWALNLCDRCWALVGNIEEFTGERKEVFCSSSKKTIETALKLYTQLLREDPDCLKVFKDVIIG